MKGTSVNSENESTETPWPRVLRIASRDEFQQSVAVAQLATKLCELEYSRSKIVKQPDDYLEEAWKLIQAAHEHVLREQTNAEYLVAHGGSHDAAEHAAGRTLSASRVRFKRLCNPDPDEDDKDDADPIELPDDETGKPIRVDWKMYTTRRAFENLFWAYWNSIGEKWKNPRQAWGQGKLKVDGISVQMYSESERKKLSELARDAASWKERGQSVLASWKKDGVPGADFLALEKFRREHDKRAENLKKKPKGKRRASIKAR